MPFSRATLKGACFLLAFLLLVSPLSAETSPAPASSAERALDHLRAARHALAHRDRGEARVQVQAARAALAPPAHKVLEPLWFALLQDDRLEALNDHLTEAEIQVLATAVPNARPPEFAVADQDDPSFGVVLVEAHEQLDKAENEYFVLRATKDAFHLLASQVTKDFPQEGPPQLHSPTLAPTTDSTGTPTQGSSAPSAAIKAEKPVWPFSQHVQEAIELNRARLGFYAQRTNGRSRALSLRMLTIETSVLPVARALDLWARPFNRQGIPILVDDFVCMSKVPTADTPPRYRGQASPAVAAHYRRLLKAYRRQVRPYVRAKDFAGAAGTTAHFLRALQDLERRGGCHFAMACHILESIGLAARNAEKYRLASHGRTDRLARVFLEAQLLGLPAFAHLDLPAQTFHAQGFGILVNELPPIPFP
jgi:hypothetical protein